MPNMMTIEEWRRKHSGSDGRNVMLWRASSSKPEIQNDGRVVRYRLSDASVARDRHAIPNSAWQLDNFEANPVFLWAHDAESPPIGRVGNITRVGDSLMGDVEYMDADTYPFADMIFRMVKEGFVNAVSMGFNPLEWTYPADKKRAGGVDFKKVDLMEVSQVPVPSLTTALATARSAGIDTGPMVKWAEKVLDDGKMILLPRTEVEAMRRAAKMPKPSKPAPVVVEQSAAPVKRGLYTVGSLAYLLSQLAYIKDSVRYEEDIEEDGSAIGERLVASLKELGQILVDLTVEEVAELVATGDDVDGSVVEMSAMPKAQRAVKILMDLSQSHARRKGVRYILEASEPVSDTVATRIQHAFKAWMSAPDTLLIIPAGAKLRSFNGEGETPAPDPKKEPDATEEPAAAVEEPAPPAPVQAPSPDLARARARVTALRLATA
jgi:HK97 family phage prohead protease